MRDPLVVEPSAEHDCSIIWMHGLGASAFDFYDMPRIIRRPGTRWIFPNAPVRPVTLNNGWKMPSWFDIRFLAESPEDKGRECPVEAEDSAGIIRSLIQREHEKGVPYERIVLIGFSQGGAMSLYTGCRYPNRLAGMVCLSGYLLFHDAHITASDDANRNTPILICHGTRDDMVPHWAAQESVNFLKEGGWPVEFEEYPISHEISMTEIEKVSVFLSKILD